MAPIVKGKRTPSNEPSRRAPSTEPSVRASSKVSSSELLSRPSTTAGIQRRPSNPNAAGHTVAKLASAITGSSYLDEHGIPEILDDCLRELIHQRPGDPIRFLVARLVEVWSQRNPGASPLDAVAPLFTPRDRGGVVGDKVNEAMDDIAPIDKASDCIVEPLEVVCTAISQKESSAKASVEPVREPKNPRDQRARMIENAMLAVAVGAKGAIGPATVEQIAAESRQATCDHALEHFDEENENNGHKKHFMKKLQRSSEENGAEAKAAEVRVAEARRRFAELMPVLAAEVAPMLKKTEAAYWAALEVVMKKEPDSLKELERFTEGLNRGPLVAAGVKVQVIVQGRFVDTEIVSDEDAKGPPVEFSEDTSLPPMLVQAKVVDPQPSKDGKVRVLLFWEQEDSELCHKKGFFAEVAVDRRFVYGGQADIKQPLPANVDHSSVQACVQVLLAVYDLSEQSLPMLVSGVEAAVVAAAAQVEKQTGCSAHIKVKPAPLKAFERAAAKAAEKYKLRFEKLLDVARLTVVCDQLVEVVAVVKALDRSNGLKIVRMKNRINPLFSADESAGYRDVLLNVVVEETKCVCEVQVTLASFVQIKGNGGHGAYKIGRVIGTDRREETTHAGALDENAVKRTASGLTQRLILEGTTITAKSRFLLFSTDGLASAATRIVELKLGACHGLSKLGLPTLLTSEVCEAMSATIRVIDFTATGVTGSIGEIALHKCTRLEILMLGDNHLSGPLPATFGNLCRLRVLRLQENKLECHIPFDLGNLEKLEILELQYCCLTGEIPSSLGKLSRLRSLYLHGNKLTGAVPKELGQLLACTVIELRNNLLTGEVPEELAQPSVLTQITLGSNNLRNTGGFKSFFESIRPGNECKVSEVESGDEEPDDNDDNGEDDEHDDSADEEEPGEESEEDN